MIQDKFSALIGFGLFLYAIATILGFIGLWQVSTFFGVIGCVNTLFNGCIGYAIYKHFMIK